MGIVSTSLSQSNNMKFLLVLAVAAYARAEAEARDPRGFVYTTGHVPLTYGYPYAVHHPLVYTAPVGCQNNEGVAVPCAHGVLPYGLVPAVAAPAAAEDEAVESVEKREAEPTAGADAEADPEADPWLYYHGLGFAAHPYGYGYYGYGHHLGYYGHRLGYSAYHGYPYAHYGYYGKREAEAEPPAQASPEANPYHPYGYGSHGLSYNAGYGYHVGYAANAAYHPYAVYTGCRHSPDALVPCAQGA